MAKPEQPKDEAPILIEVNYPNKLAIPASLASVVLERLEVWKREYSGGEYVIEPSRAKPELHLIPVREVVAARMLSHMLAEQEAITT